MKMKIRIPVLLEYVTNMLIKKYPNFYEWFVRYEMHLINETVTNTLMN